MKTIIKTEEVRKILVECYRKLRKLRVKTPLKTTRHRYISVLMNWLWFLRQIELKDSKNLRFLDIQDIYKVKKGKVGIENARPK